MQDHYAVLALTNRRSDPSLSVADVRKAYHRSLLAHHPDKSTTSPAGPTVDQITAAFDVLKDPKARAEYDRDSAQVPESQRYFSGLDVVDLDDLTFHNESLTWRMPCRCGHGDGFIVTEPELEAAAGLGEVVLGCRGCSLWLKVLFQSAPDEAASQEGK